MIRGPVRIDMNWIIEISHATMPGVAYFAGFDDKDGPAIEFDRELAAKTTKERAEEFSRLWNEQGLPFTMKAIPYGSPVESGG